MRTIPRMAIAGLLAATAAHAHETWLVPSKFHAEPGEQLRFDLTSGMTFPKLESPIQPGRVAHAALRIGGENVPIAGAKAGKTSLAVNRSVGKPGTATVWIDLTPREIDLKDDEVAEYLDEIGAPPDLREVWAEQKGKIPWRETYTKHAKTFVAIGDASADGSWREPVGSALELIPKTNPFEARAGATFSVRLLRGGKPLPWHPVGLNVEGAAERVFATTGEDGAATFTLPRAGRAMFCTVRLDPPPEGGRWVSDFATMTFDVRK